MCCRRAPELAAGAFMRMLDHLLGLAQNLLLFEIADISASAEDQAVVMRDFNHGRRHIWFTFQVKLSHWGLLPWLFLGLGHHVLATARAICRRILQLRDNSAIREAPDHDCKFARNWFWLPWCCSVCGFWKSNNLMEIDNLVQHLLNRPWNERGPVDKNSFLNQTWVGWQKQLLNQTGTNLQKLVLE